MNECVWETMCVVFLCVLFFYVCCFFMCVVFLCVLFFYVCCFFMCVVFLCVLFFYVCCFFILMEIDGIYIFSYLKIIYFEIEVENGVSRALGEITSVVEIRNITYVIYIMARE
jgi:hypothetical protein